MTNKTAVKDINPNEIEIFKKSLSNESTTLMENDEGYEEALNRWANNAKKRAGLIVMAFTLEDVVATVNFARKHGCDFAVRGGGHSPSGFSSSNGGIVLDMRKRNKVQVDPQQKLVHVQAGAVWGDVNIAVHEHGLAVVGATVEDVGVSGSTLCGGLGFLTPKHGFIIDSLVGATIVLADGSVKQLSSTSNEDLFWAIRGAGPNFGVVTDFIFKAYDQPNKVVIGYLIYPAEKLKEIVDATNDWLNDRQLDEDVFLTICKTPPDFSTKIIMLLFKNDPSHEKFRARFSGYYKLEPIKDTTRPLTYFEANTLQKEGLNFNSRRAISGGHVCPPLKYSTFKSVLDSYNDFIRDHPDDNINGAVIAEFHNHNAQNITGDATAYPHRKRMYHIVVVQQWTNESTDEDSLKWTTHIANLFSQDHNSPNNITLNFHGPNLVMKDGDVILEDDANPKDAYGDNLERLKRLKAKYDPTIFFDKSIVIRPSKI